MYKIIYPKSEITKKHIVNYDILQEFQLTESLKYYAFPQKGITISFMKNVDIEINDFEIIISKSEEDNLKALFLGKYLQPLTMTYKNFIEEISVNFNETGVNYFFQNFFSTGKSNLIQVFDGKDLRLESEKLFGQNTDECISYIENYLNDKYAFQPISKIEKAIEIINTDSIIKIKEVADKVFMTEKTLNRQFQKYVGCTLSKYKSIVKFRNTVTSHFNDSTLNLTELCLENDYFDSPHFNKEIRKIANFNPNIFFKKVKANGLQAYPYVFQ